MNESFWSFLSVAVTLRPTQNTIASSKRPLGLTGVRTVIAVALPSTLAIEPTLSAASDFRPGPLSSAPLFLRWGLMRFIKAGLLPLLAAAIFATPASAASNPSPGSAGLGDRLFPTLGNGGYDAKHYDLSLYYGSAAPQQSVRGLVKMRAVATQSLSRFNLDYAGDDVHGVWVDGRRAWFRRDGSELVITPARSIRDDRSFEVMVSFTGGPYRPEEGDPGPIGWFTTRRLGDVGPDRPRPGHLSGQ